MAINQKLPPLKRPAVMTSELLMVVVTLVPVAVAMVEAGKVVEERAVAAMVLAVVVLAVVVLVAATLAAVDSAWVVVKTVEEAMVGVERVANSMHLRSIAPPDSSQPLTIL